MVVVGKSARTMLAAVVLLLLPLTSCGSGKESSLELPEWPVFLFAVDGLEWDVMLPLLESGRLPNMKSLMDGGSYGKLESMVPTYSPVIWTSVATGKSPDIHGIEHFVKNHDAEGIERALYSNSDRKTKAIWNVFSDFNKTVHTVGWWMTFPVEPINGVMVAQANTRKQMDTDGGKAIWKGTLIRGLAGQVWPEEKHDTIMEIAAEVDADLDRLGGDIFGNAGDHESELGRRLRNNTIWSLRADTIYLRIARMLQMEDPSFDLMMVYFGGPDVTGHRFWRYAYPDLFDHRPGKTEIAAYSGIINAYYEYVDNAIGEIVAGAEENATVFLVSDHGMHGENMDQTFDADLPPADVNSGHHMDGPAGVMIASGRFIERAAAGTPIPARAGDLRTIGKVLDIAPTILALKGIPIGADMEGIILQSVLDRSFLKAHPPRFVDSHDTKEWLEARPGLLYAPSVEEERIEQLRALGYVQ